MRVDAAMVLKVLDDSKILAKCIHKFDFKLKFVMYSLRERAWTPAFSSLSGRNTSFSSSAASRTGHSGDSNGSNLSTQNSHDYYSTTPMRVHFTDGSAAGSTGTSVITSKRESSKVREKYIYV